MKTTRSDCAYPQHKKDKKTMRCQAEVIKYLQANTEYNPKTGCYEWTGALFNSGYGSACINYKTYLAHRLSYSIFIGPIGQNKVLHTCDNPKCINPSHLFLGSQQDNMDDKVRKNRQYKPKGVLNKNAKLTDEDIRLIKASSKRVCELAREFNVHQSRISRIKNNKAWDHIQ